MTIQEFEALASRVLAGPATTDLSYDQIFKLRMACLNARSFDDLPAWAQNLMRDGYERAVASQGPLR